MRTPLTIQELRNHLNNDGVVLLKKGARYWKDFPFPESEASTAVLDCYYNKNDCIYRKDGTIDIITIGNAIGHITFKIDNMNSNNTITVDASQLLLINP